MKSLFFTTLMMSLALAAVHPKPFEHNPLDTQDAEKDRVIRIPGQGPFYSANYAGYLDLDSEVKAFYYMVESENNPDKDPVMLWLSGGPGCSSILAMYTEMGPYLFRHGGKLVRNDFSWTRNATMIWLESPGGVGFSRGPKDYEWSDNSTAEYNYKALKMLFNRFPRLKNNDFYLSGESYAGHYVPQLAHTIFYGDDSTMRGSMKGFMVGNPCTGEIGCHNPDPTVLPYLRYMGMAPFDENMTDTISNTEFDPYDILAPACIKQQELYMTQSFTAGTPHLNRLRSRLLGSANGLNGRLPDPPAPYGPCALQDLGVFINKREVRVAIHADRDTKEWGPCGGVNYRFNYKGVTHIYNDLAAKTNWNMLVFSGVSDSIVNHVQTHTVLIGMNRTLKNNKMRAWYVPDLYIEKGRQLGGFFIEWDRITFATVRGAGHMVPQSAPPAGFELFYSFLTTGGPGRLH